MNIKTTELPNAKSKDFALPDFIIPDGYQLLINTEGRIRRIFIIKSGSRETVYQFDLVEDGHCIRMDVWKQAGFQLPGFSRAVFSYILLTHDIMITGEQIGSDTRRFWLDRIGESLTIAERNVYYSNIGENMTSIIEAMPTFDIFLEEIAEHNKRSFIISTRSLLES